MTNYQPATLATYALREMQNEYVSRRIEYGKPAVGRLNHLGCFEKLPARGPRFLKLGKVPLDQTPLTLNAVASFILGRHKSLAFPASREHWFYSTRAASDRTHGNVDQAPLSQHPPIQSHQLLFRLARAATSDRHRIQRSVDPPYLICQKSR
jgi:hypothetical protein